ncbi:MAG: hypothetical protein K2V38_22085, partial [Gemmataceae bacterium]|nr:hypothetical protein [Gemmataceae bacterium]
NGILQDVGEWIVDYKPVFRIKIMFGLRVHAAEQIVNRFTGGTDETSTWGLKLRDVAPEVEEPAVVRNTRELRAALARLVPALEEAALPLLDALRDAASVERLYNDPGSSLYFRAPEPYRAMKAVTLAHLVGNPDRDRLMAEYRPGVVRQGQDCADSYDRLVEYLKSRPLGEP